MSDLLRLARELDKEAEDWNLTRECAASSGCVRAEFRIEGRVLGLRQAAEMARHMYKQACKPCDALQGR